MKTKGIFFSRKVIPVLITVCMLFNIMIVSFKVNAADVSSTSIGAYTLSTGRVTTYTSPNGKKSGYIEGSTDYCTILSIESGWVKIRYPIAGGTKVAYAKSSDFFINPNFTCETVYTGKNMKVYRRSDMSQTIGEVYANDGCVYVGTHNGKTQIIYPISGGFKLGFIDSTVSGSTSQKATVEEGWYFIKSSIDPEYVLDIEGGSNEDAANATVWKFNGGYNQVFYLKHMGDGYYQIIAKHSNKCLDVYKKADYDTANVVQHSINNGDNQLFKIERDGNNVRFKSKSANKYLDVANGKAKSGSNIQIYSGNNTPAQSFILSKAIFEDNASSSAPITTNNKRQEIVNYALSQCGQGDYRGNNDCVYNTWYYGRTINEIGYAWCQAFVSYCANQVGVLDSAIPKTASCSTAVQWYKDRGQFRLRGSYVPKEGDLVFYGNNGSSHVGIIISDPVDGYLQVVEGNVLDSKTGNYTVQKYTKNKNRRIDSSYVYGYGVPNY